MVSFSTLAIIALVIVACFCAGKLFFRVDTKIEERRNAALSVVAVLRKFGLVRLPDILQAYAIGDYSGAWEKFHDFAKLVLSGEEAVLKEFDEVFKRVLESKLKNPEARAYIQSQLDATRTEVTVNVTTPVASPTPSALVTA